MEHNPKKPIPTAYEFLIVLAGIIDAAALYAFNYMHFYTMVFLILPLLVVTIIAYIFNRTYTRQGNAKAVFWAFVAYIVASSFVFEIYIQIFDLLAR